IRDIRRNEFGEYLITAGPPDNPVAGKNDTWQLYTWNGVDTNDPVLNQTLPTPDFTTTGVWESIVSVPHPLVAGAPFRLVTDSGDTLFYGPSTVPGAANFLKSYSQAFTLH